MHESMRMRSDLLDEQVELLSDLPARIALDGREALQVGARQTGSAAPGERLLHLWSKEKKDPIVTKRQQKNCVHHLRRNQTSLHVFNVFWWDFSEEKLRFKIAFLSFTLFKLL